MSNILVLLALAGGLFSFSVFVEVLEKLGGAESPTWSALKFMGPQLWHPINGDPVRVAAAIAILVFSVLYFSSCCILDKAASRHNAYLVVPWVLCEASTIVYQVCAALNVRDRFTKTEVSLLSLDTLLGLAAVWYVILQAKSWLLEGSSKRSHCVSATDGEAGILPTHESHSAPEGRPLLSVRQCLSKIAPKPWKPVEASMLEEPAVIELAGGRRVHFQTPERISIEECRLAQPPPDNTSVSSADASDSENRAVLSCIGGNWLVKYVKPSDTAPKTVAEFRGQSGNGSAHGIAADKNESSGQCDALDCDYWPCNGSMLPRNSKSIGGDLQLGSCIKSSTAERMYWENGSCLRDQEVKATENIYDIPEYAEEPTGNLYTSNIYVSSREINAAKEFASSMFRPKIQKCACNGGLILPDLRQSITGNIGGREDSSVPTDSFNWSRNSSDDKSDTKVSTCNRGAEYQQTEATSDRESLEKIRQAGSSRPGNIWMWASPEPTKRSLLSGGRGLGYVYSASDMDLIVFAPQGSMYRGSLARNASVRDIGGSVWQRMFPPCIERMRSNSWDCSIADVGPIKYLNCIPGLSCPSLTCQSGSSLSQTTSEFLEERMRQQATISQYNQAVPTGASVDRVYDAGSEMGSSSSRYETGSDSFEQKHGQTHAPDPGVDTSEEDLVDHAWRLGKYFPQNVKRSENLFAGGMNASRLPHSLSKSF